MSRPQLVTVLIAIMIAAAAGYLYLQEPEQPPPPEDIVAELPQMFTAALSEQGLVLDESEVEEAGTTKPAGGIRTAAAAAPVRPSDEGPDAGAAAPEREYVFEDDQHLRLVARNAGKAEAAINHEPGTIFSSGRRRVMLIKPVELKVPPGGSAETTLPVVAVKIDSAEGNARYEVAAEQVKQVEPLLKYLKEHPDVPHRVAQLAVLIAADDAPPDALSNFKRIDSRRAAMFPRQFKSATSDLIAALLLLRAAGIDEKQTALARDQQLKIEAMIDPAAHDQAAEYYGISKDREWAYWKRELLEGSYSFRHYALYGIARFYPEIAVEMLPQWAGAPHLRPVLRLSAIRALALTEKPEALQLLEELREDLSDDPLLEQTLDQAIAYLAYQQRPPAGSGPAGREVAAASDSAN